MMKDCHRTVAGPAPTNVRHYGLRKNYCVGAFSSYVQKRKISLISKSKAGPVTPLLRTPAVPALYHRTAIACLIPYSWLLPFFPQMCRVRPIFRAFASAVPPPPCLSTCHSSAVVLNLGCTLEILEEPYKNTNAWLGPLPEDSSFISLECSTGIANFKYLQVILMCSQG